MGNICSNSGREEKKNPMIEPSNDTEDESPSPDSAPFVAAVLNDRTVTGLIQENNELKNEIDVLQSRENKRLSVQSAKLALATSQLTSSTVTLVEERKFEKSLLASSC